MANYPVPYQNNWNSGGIGQQVYPQYGQYPQYPQSGSMQTAQTSQGQTYGPGLIWVDGEVGAKAFQMPAGWPANQPIDLWDTNDTVIYLKSVNPFGMPNPLQKAHYTLEEQVPKYTGRENMRTESGDAEKPHDMSQYVRKDELDTMKAELMDAIRESHAAEVKGARANGKATV